MQGIDTACQTYFDEYVATHGQPPGRNAMLRALEGTAVSGERVKRDWRRLMGKAPVLRPDHHPHQEAAVLTSPPHDAPVAQPGGQTWGTLARGAALALSLIAWHRHDGSVYPLVALVILRADGNGVPPTVSVIAAPRRLEAKRGGVAAILSEGERTARLNAAVLILHGIGGRARVHARTCIRDCCHDGDRDQLAVRWPQGVWGDRNDSDHWRGRIA